MATDEKWYFTKEQLANTPSRRCGVDADKELSYRQQAANFIQDMGQRLAVTQLCINTAIVYMHRFYVFHSLSQFHRNSIASAALFLAAKVEEQPRKLEHVIKVSHLCLYRDQNPPDTKSEAYLEQAQDLVFNENVLLQTLGFDVAIDHPHTHVVRCCHLVKASKDLAQTSYFMASNSLHLTTMCLQYKPTVVACFCIHLACKWSNWEIPQSNEGKHWFWYVDRTVTSEQLQQLTGEFLHIFDKCPSRLKRKIMSISANQSPSLSHPSLPNSPFDTEPRKVQSPANDGGPTFQSLRLHHSDKQEEKKLSSSLPLRPPVDYREYREKKERERLEREKSVTSSATVQNHLPDLNKHHSHHHKSGASAVGAPGKHPLSSGQKNALHHNHHHRPDVKMGQMVPQRHSGSSQRSEIRDPNRDPNRQRVPREYNSSSGTSGGTMYSHSHPTHLSKDANVVDVNSLIDSSTSRVDTNLLQEPTPHNNPPEKLSNNNHNVHRLNATDCKPHDKRAYDPRHKPPDHRKDVDSMQKLYGKYPDPSRAERQRKPDSLEQRSEEVRKLIEKPLPPPKPRLEIQKEENIAGMLKQPHHAKFSQQDKQQNNSSVNANELKMPFASRSGYAPEIPVSATSQGVQKATATVKLLPNQLSTHGTVSQILKDTMNNGNSQPLSNAEELKTEKRMRHDEIDRTSSGLQQGLLQTPPGKHRSLFSPEKTPAPRESHSQRVKSKQKTPPLAVAKLKQERLPDPSTNLNLVMPFSSPPGVAQQQESSQVKRSASDIIAPSHKKHRMSNTNDAEQKVRMKTEDLSNFETIKMLGRVPELIQPIRDVTSSNGRSASIVNDLKPSELIKPLQPEATSQMNIVVQELGAPSTNGLDSNVDKLLLSHQENNVKLEGIKQEFSLHEVPIVEIKKDNLSPMKSAQSISALLQEPLAPMPSLLQGMHQFGLSVQKPTYSEQIHQQLVEPIKQDPLLSVSSQSTSLPGVSEAALVPSTVDISALNAAPLPGPCEITDQTVVSAPLVVPLVGSTEKKSEHHKSEKKKKKEKHKHKDKEKAKDKHKHKHKDKEKLRLKETGGEHMPGVGSLKITIPKEKITLSTEAAVPGATGASAAEVKNKSPQGTGLKIKIPKERLKAADSVSGPMAQPVVQAPLKIKIRTDAISRSSVTGDLIVNDSRKRERERDATDSPAIAGPPSKKHSQGGGVAGGGNNSNSGTTNYTNQQRSGERQNGRHYNSSSNNKEKHTSSHHKSSNKLSQSQQHQHQHQQQSHAT